MSPVWSRRKELKPAEVVELEAAFGNATAWGVTEAGTAILATEAKLVLGGDPLLQLPWQFIDHAAWDPPTFALSFRDPASGASRRLRVAMAQEGELPRAVRAGVTQSVVASRRVPLRGDLGAVVAARRDSGGTVGWTVVFDNGLDPSDPVLQAEARAALADLRRALEA